MASLMSVFRRTFLVTIAVACCVPASAQTYQPRHPVPASVQEIRRRMFDAGLNMLTFRTVESFMDTRRVANAAPVWVLPRTERPLDFAYTFEGQSRPAIEALERTHTNALLVIKDGRIVHENYRNQSDETSRFASWSMSKSITSILVGIAVGEGRIGSVDDQIVKYVPELQGTGYDGVTLRQALQMRSGVDFQERYDFANPSPAQRGFQMALVENSGRYADLALTAKRARPPGATFEYRTLDTSVLGWVLERAVGQSITDFTAAKLWRPLGAEAHGAWIMDGPPSVGREFNGAGFVASLRDYGRLGLMMLNGGVAQDRRLVSADWVRQSTTPTSGGPDQAGGPMGYGYHWWTVAGSQAFAAVGLQGQFIYVDPATRTVIVKLSYFPPGDPKAEMETLAFLQAASRWNPR